MKKFLFNFIIYFTLLTSAWAHHPSHVSSGHANLLLFKGNQSKPSSQLYLNYSFNYLDESVGQVHQWTLGGEWAFHQQLSVLGYLPFTYLAHNFRSEELGLGDMALGLKWQFTDYQGLFGFITSMTTLPTGEASSGLGQGSVGQQLDLLLGYTFAGWSIYGSSNISFTYASPHQPVMGVLVGMNTPRIFKKIYFSLGLDSQIFLVSNVLTHRSWKMFVEPQMNVVVGKAEHWTVSLGGKFSVVDALHRQAGVAITNTDSILLSDTLWGVNLGLNYRF